MVGLSTLLILGSLSYTLAIFGLSRRRKAVAVRRPDDLLFVFLVPSLNEELVIGSSLERLLALPGGDVAVLVIDDGSDDQTAEIVQSYDPERVWLLQRSLPRARQGKGRALNHAFRYLRESGRLGDRDHSKVIVCVLDADGRLAPNTLLEVAPYFCAPDVGAVQIGVRMYNASESLLARMQDFEFVTFTEMFQRARQRLGSVGLGGNGQFARLAALEDLGDEPWTDMLTEDLDLGLRLLVAGWRNDFCRTAYVAQQALVSGRRLLRQRVRWFQGHLQCWTRVPMVMRSQLPARAVADLVFHLVSPSLVLVMTFPILAFAIGLMAITMQDPALVLTAAGADRGMVLAGWYILSFGLAPFYGFVYWLKNDDISIGRALLYAHAFSVYSYLWVLAGWGAVWRVVRGNRGWTKTARHQSIEAEPELEAERVPAGR